MPRLTEPAAIAEILETDRPWSAFALGDLAPGYFENCSWYGTPGSRPALILLYRGFEAPVFFALGEPESVAALLPEVALPPAMHLQIRPEILPVLQERYSKCAIDPMWRMLLEPAAYRPVSTAGTVRLTLPDAEALLCLYQSGDAARHQQFFRPAMLEHGVWYGIREGEDLTAVAGTHLVVPSSGIGAVGSVYTRADRRGRGLGRAVTTAVTDELLRLGLQTIVLNVRQNNAVAIRLYEQLGYARYCACVGGFAEGLRP